MLRRWLSVSVVVVVLAVAARVRAETWQAPVGGRALAVDGRVACPGATGDWSMDSAGVVRPPSDDKAAGATAEVKVAPSLSACGSSLSTMVTLLATGKWPALDLAGATVSVDDGRVEIRGRGLRGVGVAFRAGAATGDDRCLAPLADGVAERCLLAAARGMPADPAAIELAWAPAFGRFGGDVVTFDASGRRVAASELALRVARVVVARVLPADAVIDLTAARVARIPLVHPEGVSSVDCGGASCEIEDGAIVLRRLPSISTSVPIRLRLAPRVVVQRGDAQDASPTTSVPVLPCALTVPSGEAVRGVDDTRLVVRIEARCAAEVASLRFTVSNRPAEVLSTTSDGGASLLVIRAGRIESDEVTVLASRGASDGSAVAQVRVRARALAPPHAALQLDDGQDIEFIPSNRPALVRYVREAGAGVLEVMPIEGVLQVEPRSGASAVRAEKGAGGFVVLRFGYRVPSLPGALATTVLAVLSEPVQRPIREAPLAVPLLDASSPFAEVLCTGNAGAVRRLSAGLAEHVPYLLRDTCRLVLHRERLGDESGAQRLLLEVDVTRIDGTPRPEAHLSQPLTLRPATEPRTVWLKGATGRFDRVTVRLTQAADDDHAPPSSSDALGAQWAYVTGTGHGRLYATTAIPTGLYRVSDRPHSGILTLNFGVVSRLTWLDEEGHEGFLALEAGVMGVGLANDVSPQGHSLTQAAVVTGVGLGIPIANRSLATETSINLHTWFEYEVSRGLGNGGGSPFAFVFGPSISIGNIGTNL